MNNDNNTDVNNHFEIADNNNANTNTNNDIEITDNNNNDSAGSRLNNRNCNHNEMNNDNNTDVNNHFEIADNNDIDINNHIEMTDNISNQSTHNNRIEINNDSQDCRRKRWSHHEINILVEFILDKKIEMRKLNRLGLNRTKDAILNKSRIIKRQIRNLFNV
nr:6205_t:CDS:1 [Entrophospora candida]